MLHGNIEVSNESVATFFNVWCKNALDRSVVCKDATNKFLPVKNNPLHFYPPTLILDTRDIISSYQQALVNILGNSEDLNELASQAIQKLLNDDLGKLGYREYFFPDTGRLVSFKASVMGSESIAALTIESNKFLSAIQACLQELNAYTDDGFPYYFESFLGKDMVLRHLPY